jgi:hypothetical protein
MRSALVVAILVACGGSHSKPAEHEREGETEQGEVERGAIPDDVVGPPKVAWAELDHRQRAAFMDRVVVPTMKPLFVAFDGAAFRDFGCATCHGEPRVKDKTFKMPNPALAALTDEVLSGKPAWVKFMTSEVAPEMAKLLGLPELDRTRPAAAQATAFGCANCHART